MRHAPHFAVMLALLLLPAGCAAPALQTYVLAVPTDPAAASVEAMPADVIELRPVLLPEPIDTRDIVRSAGPSRLLSSRNGRWASRLSVGLRQALADDLSVRLPRSAIVTRSPLQPDFRRLSLTVARFDLDDAGTLVLDADWIVETARPPAIVVHRRAHLVAAGVATGDAAQVAAMSGLVDQLAAAIARDL